MAMNAEVDTRSPPASKSPKNMSWDKSVAPENFVTLLLTWNTHGETFEDINRDKENVVEKIFKEGYNKNTSNRVNGDMIIVSLQEIVELDLDHILYDSNNDIEKQKNSWTDHILNIVNSDNTTDDLEKYTVLSNRAVVGTYILILIKQKHVEFVRELEHEDVRLQRYLGGTVQLGNKAGLLTRFTMYEQSFCVCSAHLAAHRKNNHERIDQLTTIFNESWTGPGSVYATKFNRHDHCFFLGDVNSRIVESFDTKTAYDLAGNGTSAQPDILTNLDTLSKQDQFKRLLTTNLKSEPGSNTKEENESLPSSTTSTQEDTNKYIKYILKGWKENELTFCPTYKLNLKNWKGQKGYKVDKTDCDKYAPSWTDRIFHKCLDHDCHENIYYKSFELENPVSDHFPVQAIINLKMKQYIKTKMEVDRTRLKGLSETDMDSSNMLIGNIDWGYFNFCSTKRNGYTNEEDDSDNNNNNSNDKNGKPRIV